MRRWWLIGVLAARHVGPPRFACVQTADGHGSWTEVVEVSGSRR